LDNDQRHIWHPYTSLTNPLPTYAVERADGMNIYLKDGSVLTDGMSSWWACVHGYSHPKLVQAAKAQVEKMSHVMFGGFSHEPADLLAEKLLEITPANLENVFFCDSGSVAVEVAMKMAIQYHFAIGEDKKTFITAKFGYHGDTTGAMSVCDPKTGMHSLFTNFLPKHIFGPAFPLGYTEELDKGVISQYRRLFNENKENLAAFIIEPVIQGAGGMRIYNPLYLVELKKLCKEFGILFIADEIATGFGRTGKLFACEHAQIEPDILCLGKALSGGMMSFAATLSSTKIANTISNNAPHTFMHGPTFMGNPLACAVSLASINLLHSDVYKWQQKVQYIEKILKKELTEIKGAKSIRVLGAVGIVEFYREINVAEAQRIFVKEKVWIRPFKNLIYIMPPFIAKAEHIKRLVHGIKVVSKMDNCFRI